MKPFSYVRPGTLDQLLDALATHGTDARVLAGGTDVIVRLRMGHMRPKIVVDLKRVPELSDRIIVSDDRVRIGARVVMTTVVNDAHCQRHFPALVEAASVVGSVQIRNRATMAGNICNASPACDTAPALLVHDAVVNTVSRTGHRQVPLAEFFTGPGRTALQTGEIVASIDLPMPRHRVGAAFGRVTRRFGVDLATINLCCAVTADGQTRFAFGAVGPRPFVVADTTGNLGNPAATPAASDAALAALITQAAPISDVRGSREYRHAMLGVMSRRALQKAAARLHLPQSGS